MRLDSQPACADSCHAAVKSTGKAQGASGAPSFERRARIVTPPS
jgi:hypothetical protein